MRKILPLILLAVAPFISYSQGWPGYYQYFDGEDTIPGQSLFCYIDSLDTNNVWQIGPPQKFIFDSPLTSPNVMITDTIAQYYTGDTSFFTAPVNINELMMYWGGGIVAVQWVQKLDYEMSHDGGLLEFSVDTGNTWQSVFDNPYVYNFYGFHPENVDTLAGGIKAFTGTDTNWRDIWVCYDPWYFESVDTLELRFTSLSDTNEIVGDGWMIDNLNVHITIQHTIAEKEQKEYLNVYPSITNGRVFIEAKKLDEYHIIESIELFDNTGRVVQSHGKAPTKFFVDINGQPDGLYYMRIQTNKKTQTFPIILNKSKVR